MPNNDEPSPGLRTLIMAAVVALPCVFTPVAEAALPALPNAMACPGGAKAMARVDLFFGAAHVGPQAWLRFLASVVTPRFPDGLTSYDGRGQWRGSRGLTVERSRTLVIYYKPLPGAEAKIEAIRAAYKRLFSQASVLRADSSACVSF